MICTVCTYVCTYFDDKTHYVRTYDVFVFYYHSNKDLKRKDLKVHMYVHVRIGMFMYPSDAQIFNTTCMLKIQCL